MDRRPITEIGVSALVILICAVFWLQASTLPPGSFEPLGSGPVPMWTAGIVIFCCLIVMIRAALTLRRGDGWAASARIEFGGGEPAGALWMMALTLAYVALLHLRVASFGVLTFGYLTLLIWALEGFAAKRLLPALIVGAVFAFGAEYLFTEVFIVDLPD